MNLIENIEKLVNESEESASKTLEKIKKAIQNSKAPDFSQIKDGEHFFYRGIEFIRLGLEQNGVLCMTAKPYYKEAFDTDNYGDWKESSARKKLNTEFLALLNEEDLLPFESDLIADNGDTSYGKCVDKVGILSCDLYRKYRHIVPLFKEWMWTCTPWACGTPNAWNATNVRLVFSDGALVSYSANNAIGLAPACIFHL